MQDSHSYNFRSPWASPLAQLAKRETWNVGDLGLITKLRRKWLPTPVFQPGEFHGLYSPWGHKESDVTEWLSLHSKVALVVKNPPANAGDIRDEGSISGSVRSLGGGHGNPLQCSCLENPKDRRAWQVTVHRVTKSQTQLKRLSTHPWVVHPQRYVSNKKARSKCHL